MAEHLPLPRFHLLAKPTGATCNLACSYCFFLDKELLYPNSHFRMTVETLETYIQQVIQSHQGSEVTIAWQGGEPTLMGVDFYRKAIEFQQKHRRPGMTFENTMQTNGTLLNEEWCEFFKENNFLIGISLDGPAHLHDVHRVDKGGRPTFDRVMQGLRLLQSHGVEHNILVAVNSVNADYPQEVYQFLRDDAKATWIQFIPVVERINESGLNLIQEGDHVSTRSVRPAQFGRFLIQIYEMWVQNDVGKVFIQTFEAALRNWLGINPGMCVFERTCGFGMALEHNGDLYSCDHFVEPDYLLGNIHSSHMADMIGSSTQTAFGQAKFDTLPKYCLDCPVYFACKGECPKNRFLVTPNGDPGLNYLCVGYKAFFQRINESMQIMSYLMRSGSEVSKIMPIMSEKFSALESDYAPAKPDKPCPCGSGLQFQECHGFKVLPNNHNRKNRAANKPRPPVNVLGA